MKTLAVLFDFAEEGWPSMDLAASMLVEAGGRVGAGAWQLEPVVPRFHRLATRLPLSRSRTIFNADRLINRMWFYPRAAARARARFDFFHVADHSYAQLVHVLPPERTGVFCHDLDAFRSIIEPDREPRSSWFRAMAHRVLSGMRRAAIVFHSTDAVRVEILRHGLVQPERLVKAPYGTSCEFQPRGRAGGPSVEPGTYVLHVGSCVARKRIDVLLDVFHGLRQARPELRLLQVGGEFTSDHASRIARLNLGGSISQLRDLSREDLAGLYRGALLVLQPSEAEGFGLPVIEALACGAPVLASDIPVLREVGRDGVAYAPVGDVAAWTERALEGIVRPATLPPREARLAEAVRYSWEAHANLVLAAYARLAGQGRAP